MRLRAIAALGTVVVVGCSALTSFDALVGDASDAGHDAPSDAPSFADGAFDSGNPGDSAIDASPDVLALPYLVVDDLVSDPTDVVSLTEAGSLDWAHYGTNDTKNIAFHLLGTLQQQDGYYSNDARIFYWSDGTTKPSDDNPGDGVFSAQNPMTLTVLASTTPRVVTIYLGGFSCDAELDVTLGDASASKVFTGAPGGGLRLACTIHFAAEANSALNLTWKVQTYLDSGQAFTGNVAFAAVTLANE